MESVFHFTSYRNFLDAFFEASGARSGLKTQLAHAAQVQGAYLSRVLSGQAELNLEQAIRLTKLLKFDSDETDYFLLLVEKDRAGSEDLKEHFLKKINEFSQKREQIKTRVKASDVLSIEEKAEYYSSWIYSAIHMACGLEHIKTLGDISKLLNLKSEEVRKVLSFLINMGLVVQEEKSLQASDLALHLPGDSPFIIQHHKNWRLKAMQDVKKTSVDNIHFSAVMTLDEQTYKQVKQDILNLIEEAVLKVKEASSEDIYSLNMDWYKL